MKRCVHNWKIREGMLVEDKADRGDQAMKGYMHKPRIRGVLVDDKFDKAGREDHVDRYPSIA